VQNIKKMKYIFILVCLLTLSCHNNQKAKQVNGGKITIQEFDTPATEIEMSLSEEDSLLYHEVVADYGNYWETTIIANQKKQVVFDLYSGKILVYLNKEENSIIKNEPSDYSFYWEIDTLNPYKIKGIYGWKDKDTILFWKYNPRTKIITDEKGLIYHRKKFNRKKQNS
jgi:hypothetical protein